LSCVVMRMTMISFFSWDGTPAHGKHEKGMR
jgi:hypothetical protein